MIDRLGLIISCFPVRAGEMELSLELGLRGFNLEVATLELRSCGLKPSLPMQFTVLVVWKMCAPLRRVRDARLWEHRLVRAQNILNSCHILVDELVNQTDGALEDLWGKPAPQ